MARKHWADCLSTSTYDSATEITERYLHSDNDETQPPTEDQCCENEPQDETNYELYDDVEIRDNQGIVQKKRGPTRAKDIWDLPEGQKIIVQFNEFGQPIKRGGGILGGWLGTVARKTEFCSIEWTDWRLMPKDKKQILISLSKKYFEIPDDARARKWILESIARKWKDYKFELKAKYFKAGKTRVEIEQLVPVGVFPGQWKSLVQYWFSDKSKLLSEKGRAARAHYKTPHTAGSKSFARMRHEYEMTKGKKPERFEFFSITHKRKDGNFINEEAQGLAEKANNIGAERIEILENPNSNVVEEVFTTVLEESQCSRVKGYGLGVTPTQLFGTQFPKRKRSQFEVDRLQQQMQDMRANYEAKIKNMKEEYEGKMIEMKKDWEGKMARLLKEMDTFRTEFLRCQKMFSQAQFILTEFQDSLY
ncbi:hypothetical protein Scep_026110 [Stephania cephalantha]|uniref:Transposase n=1 Tax=Stephania cephalantha TaxID=152367 RepID=A0AAP0EJI1_9MAGN